MTTPTMRRDARGKFIRTCKHVVTEGGQWREGTCTTRALWYVDGWGWFGLSGTTGTPVYCKRHAVQHAASMNRAGRGRVTGTYTARRSYR